MTQDETRLLSGQSYRFVAAKPSELDCPACGASAGQPCQRVRACGDDRPAREGSPSWWRRLREAFRYE